MKFSSTITIQYDTPFSPFCAEEYHEALDWLEKSGFDGAEICISHYENIDVFALKEKLKQHRLLCSNISTGQARTLEGITLLHTGAPLEKAKKRLLEHIDAAAILDCKVTLGLIRGLGTPGKEKEEKKILAKNLEEIICYAEDKRVKIILEAINRYETTLFTSAESCMEFIERDLGNPTCMAVHWDLFHANIEDAQFDEAIDRMGDKLQHIHLADSNRYFPGYGHLDFEAIFQKLKKVDYQEYCSFECFNMPSKDIVREKAGAFIKKMKEL